MSIAMAAHDVTRLKVKMQHLLLLMHIHKGGGYITDYGQSFFLGYLMSFQVVIEIIAINIIHDVVVGAVLLKGVRHTHYIRMVKAREVQSLFLKLLSVVI